MRSNTIHWIDNLEADSQYKHLRFKMLKYVGYPRFNIFLDMVDKVGMSEFVDQEDHRLPFFIGTQFGIFPKNIYIEDGQKFAVLGKSLLSGCVAGLTIYRKQGNRNFEVCCFPNEDLTKGDSIPNS